MTSQSSTEKAPSDKTPSTRSLQREAFGLTILKNGHPDIRRIRKQTGMPAIHGNKFWKSTFLLMDYLREEPPRQKPQNEKLKILEIGCGWGLAGVFCAKEFGAEVTALDADDSVFPYLQHHAQLNDVEVNTWKCRYEDVRKADLEAFDMVIGADICFWDTMVKPLYNLTSRARSVGTRVVMTDPGRPTFREMSERAAEKLNAFYDNWITPHPHNASGLVLDVEPPAET